MVRNGALQSKRVSLVDLTNVEDDDVVSWSPGEVVLIMLEMHVMSTCFAN